MGRGSPPEISGIMTCMPGVDQEEMGIECGVLVQEISANGIQTVVAHVGDAFLELFEDLVFHGMAP